MRASMSSRAHTLGRETNVFEGSLHSSLGPRRSLHAPFHRPTLSGSVSRRTGRLSFHILLVCLFVALLRRSNTSASKGASTSSVPSGEEFGRYLRGCCAGYCGGTTTPADSRELPPHFYVLECTLRTLGSAF